MRRIFESDIPQENKRSLYYAGWEGIVTQAMIGIFDYFLIPYALFLGANPSQIGYLIAVPNLVVSFTQLLAIQALRFVASRHRMLLIGTAAQTVLLLAIAMLVVVALPGKIWFLIALIGLFRMGGSIMGPAWGSLVSDYVPSELRGEYFGWRSRWMSFAGLVGMGLWAWVLGSSRYISEEAAFGLLFLCAAGLRFVSFRLMRRMADLPLHPAPSEESVTLVAFLRRFRRDNFMRFVLYAVTMTFATQFGVPFLSVHMLENLEFSYVQYTAVHMAGLISALVAFPVWGRHADMVGNASVIRLISFVLPLFPILWIFARTPAMFIAIELFAGFMWGGFNMCATNFIYDLSPSAHRVRYLSYFNLLNGLAVFAGATLGGHLVERLPPLQGFRLCSLFLISGLLRLFADLFLRERFSEVRPRTHKTSSRELFFSVLGIRPLVGRESIWEENEP